MKFSSMRNNASLWDKSGHLTIDMRNPIHGIVNDTRNMVNFLITLNIFKFYNCRFVLTWIRRYKNFFSLPLFSNIFNKLSFLSIIFKNFSWVLSMICQLDSIDPNKFFIYFLLSLDLAVIACAISSRLTEIASYFYLYLWNSFYRERRFTFSRWEEILFLIKIASGLYIYSI